MLYRYLYISCNICDILNMSAAYVNTNTPTKKVRKKFKRVPDDFCHICKCSFQLKKVALLKINKEENIDGVNILLASFCESICGFNPKYNNNLSNRVCKICARKICDLGLFCEQLKKSVNQVYVQFGNTTSTSDDIESGSL